MSKIMFSPREDKIHVFKPSVLVIDMFVGDVCCVAICVVYRCVLYSGVCSMKV